MGTFVDFEHQLHNTLQQLYNPTFEPPDLLLSVIGVEPGSGTGSIQPIIAQAIKDLEPLSDVPKNTRVHRLYTLLDLRYVQGLMQKETAQHLDLTIRHVRREQKLAIHMLAQRLWDLRGSTGHNTSTMPTNTPSARQAYTELPSATSSELNGTSIWRSQVQRELAVLHLGRSGAVADVSESIQGAVSLGQVLADERNVQLIAEAPECDLFVSVHPSVLREVLLTMVDKVVQTMSTGEIQFHTTLSDDTVTITVQGYPSDADVSPYSEFINEALSGTGSTADAHLTDRCIQYKLTMPSANRRTILVIDDNTELVRFYRHFVSATPYEIVHITEGLDALAAIEEKEPNAIILDIMLPDIDGWDLFSQLKEHPRTGHIPIIICSVVRREDMAKAMGAAQYLQKPIRRQHLIQALDQILG